MELGAQLKEERVIEGGGGDLRTFSAASSGTHTAGLAFGRLLPLLLASIALVAWCELMFLSKITISQGVTF